MKFPSVSRAIRQIRQEDAASFAQKSALFFQGLFDYQPGGGGFYPQARGAQSIYPVNWASSDAGEVITPKIALQLSAVWACVWVIAETLSTLPICLMKRPRVGSDDASEAYDDPLYSVLSSRPNPQMEACTLWAMLIASECLWGNGYARIMREDDADPESDVIGLDPLRPEYMRPYRADSGLIRYLYQPNAPGVNGANVYGEEDFAAWQIFHLRGRSLDGLVGLSRIQYARNTLGIAAAAESSTGDIFRNGLKMAGFLTASTKLQQAQREQIRQSLDAFKRGGRDAATFMVLEAGLGFQSLSMPPQDVELLAQRQFSTEEICRWYGVPPVVIGHSAAGVTAWGTGIENIVQGWRALALRSYSVKLTQSCDRQLIPVRKSAKFFTSMALDELIAADSEVRSKIDAQDIGAGIKTRNEARAQRDLPPLPGGDVLTAQVQNVPIETLGTHTAAPVPAGGEGDKTPVVDPAQEETRQALVMIAQHQIRQGDAFLKVLAELPDKIRAAVSIENERARNDRSASPDPVPPVKLFVVNGGGEVLSGDTDQVLTRKRRMIIERDPKTQRAISLKETYE